MKKLPVLFSAMLVFATTSFAQDMNMSAHKMLHPDHGISQSHDGRISLGLNPQMKQHQLANMRSHLEAIQSIVGLLAENKFDEAAAIAHSKLGLTP
ncbi:MAG: cytochrome C, partial [Mariprofundaceae bacterium]|nr:cytochrome C [Mariprofundaceae bacterium]